MIYFRPCLCFTMQSNVSQYKQMSLPARKLQRNKARRSDNDGNKNGAGVVLLQTNFFISFDTNFIIFNLFMQCLLCYTLLAGLYHLYLFSDQCYPAVGMVYTDLKQLRGITTPVDYGSGINYAGGVINSLFSESSVALQVSIRRRTVISQHARFVFSLFFCVISSPFLRSMCYHWFLR